MDEVGSTRIQGATLLISENNTQQVHGPGTVSEDARTEVLSKEQVSYGKTVIRSPLKYSFALSEQK